MREIEESGVSLADVEDRATVDAFLGPTDPKEIEALPALGAAEDGVAGSGRYGDAWRLPLGHEARASAGVRLALLGDTRRGVGLASGRSAGHRLVPDRRRRGDDRDPLQPGRPESEVAKRLTRTVKPFWMARYPVTPSSRLSLWTAIGTAYGGCHRGL